jgi:hypothetical protein
MPIRIKSGEIVSSPEEALVKTFESAFWASIRKHHIESRPPHLSFAAQLDR